jgi:ABC-type phosphate transport system substrate-binding protein
MKIILKLALAASLALAAATAAPARAEPVAIIVNRENPKSELSTEELKSIFMGRRTEWSDGTAAQPIDQAPSAPGRAAFFDVVLGMSAARYAEHWVDQQVRGTGGAPKVAASPAAAVKLVAKIRGAVAFVPLSQVTPAVRVVALNGRMPGQRGYPMP